jgi:hypothetical protein
MASEAALAAALALLQQEICEQCWKGALLKRPQKGPPVAPIPAMSDVCSQILECEALSWGVSGFAPKVPVFHSLWCRTGCCTKSFLAS